MIKYLFPFLFILTIVNAENINTQDEELADEYPIENIDETRIDPSVDCLILQDENSIICKFETNRSTSDQDIVVQWIDPQGDVSRSRNMIVPAGHASIYDYRYINGRLLGSWTFKVLENDKEYTTDFELK
ncbi:hypothetical protein [Poseidonibacter ostreae]|jgi:hypothetical protein|uniref:DUF2914 domain-containing protein n=1 Tax=Poseidonibacter ostreae TaxID=2654171 RepID=A0A6L4WWA9_9BACT|nr:hypothetical protein [Poseidonibacter ostreae]KAB7885404.1 hypothetical protein GA417_08705 [Poseidonibacter ostreae]KAB7890334.1 hypothetical protein GBG19_03660 [Poseidonibacter ostreae]KAB7890564.1 hypothetical protein GBG18_08535 [Poseidonibacter ostreae]MAC85166.1 hypothetical protein [Arcobacter sp.]|tara:strand:+ start:945 stop:1334 length:390 start_codon:yes stop_codon:yes gene_type:complete